MQLAATQPRELVLLGTGTSVGIPVIGCQCAVCRSNNPRWLRTRASALLRTAAGSILIDTSPDLRQQLLREQIQSVEAVLYTHQHVDHVFGLDDVRVLCYYLGRPLPLYCEPAVETFIRQAFAYAFDPVAIERAHGNVPQLEFRRLERPAMDILGQRVTPIPFLHGSWEVLGFRFDTLAYCTDVKSVPESSYSLLEDLDILILNALRFDPHPNHLSLSEALAVVERVKPRQTYFTHISCKMDPELATSQLPPNVALAYDGLRIPF